MATSGDMIIKVNSGELLRLSKDGAGIVLDPKAEDAIVRLLEIQREVDGCVEWLKAEIERQALEYDPNFSALKSDKVKINYSAAGSKYKQDFEIHHHDKKIWEKKITWTIKSEGVDEYRRKFSALPAGIKENVRKKTIRISEVAND